MIQDLDTLEHPEKLPELTASVSGFLERYGTRDLMGRTWEAVFKGFEPEKRFDALLAACGCRSDAPGFFAAIAAQIRQGRPAAVVIGGVELPRLLVYRILETAMPGQALSTVRTPEKLAGTTGAAVADKAAMGEVLETYPVRLSAHVIRQSLVSGAVALQYLPFEDELDPTGHDLTFDGHFKQGLMEQMYRNRAIFLLDMRCPVYCRFCFRKHKSLRKEGSPGVEDVRAALARVGENSRIREILITGGEPLLNRRNLEAAVDGLIEIPHVEALRIATRSLAYYPHLFLHHDGEVVSYLKSLHARCRPLGKRLEIGLHMLHPDEISVQTLEIISDLTASGIPVYLQTPFLKGVNHEGPVLGELFTRLRQAGTQIYYIFTPCHPIHGTRKYWSPISLSFEAYRWLRENISDRCMPKLCTATPLGKMEWHTSGWAVAPDREDPDHIWIRTPYTREYFKAVTGEAPLPVETRQNSGGSLDVKCLIDMGDPSLFLGEAGPEGSAAQGSTAGKTAAKSGSLSAEEVQRIQSRFYVRAYFMKALGDTGVKGLVQVHPTRAVLTLEPETDLSGAAADYLAGRPEITDIILRIPAGFSETVIDELKAVEMAGRRLALLDRYLCIRLQWARIQTNPDQFSPDHISRLRSLARFGAVAPFRMEFETWWLTADQIRAAHRALVAAITDAGMAVYANTALITGVNTGPEQAEALVHAVRQGGMDFHQVYTGGLEMQKQENEADPLGPARVVALASRVRMSCTGREVPLYVYWTPSGERDFGLPG